MVGCPVILKQFQTRLHWDICAEEFSPDWIALSELFAASKGLQVYYGCRDGKGYTVRYSKILFRMVFLVQYGMKESRTLLGKKEKYHGEWLSTLVERCRKGLLDSDLFCHNSNC